jgi:hypothetical protein
MIDCDMWNTAVMWNAGLGGWVVRMTMAAGIEDDARRRRLLRKNS